MTFTLSVLHSYVLNSILSLGNDVHNYTNQNDFYLYIHKDTIEHMLQNNQLHFFYYSKMSKNKLNIPF